MTLTQKLASALCWASLFITLSSNAQIDSTTGNLINSGTAPTDTTSTWNNGVYVNQLCFYAGEPGNCGPYPSIRNGSNINFSYGTADLNQVVNINRALAAGGTGVQLSGFNFGFMAKNGNGWDDGRQDYLAAYVKLYNSAGALAANYDYSAQTNQRYNWTNFNFSETFASPLLASQYSNAQVGFVGRDNNFWAGNYGPEIYNVSFSLKYRVDPCATNPAYSPNCANFSTVATSNNLVPNPNGYAVYGDSINQSYAINTALANAGSAAQIHGFQWGYVANANGPYCAFWLIACFDNRDPSVTTNVNITNSAGASLYNVTREYKNSYNTTEYSYLFPSSQTMSTLGNFNFTASTNDVAYVGSMWSRALYTADPCAVNPLSSPTCSGYAVAYAKLMASTTVAPATAPAPAPAPPELAAAAPALAEASPTQSSPAPASPPPPAPAQDTTVAQADPAQPSPTQPGPAPAGSPAPAGGPAQTTTTASSSSSSSSPSSSAGPSKLAMSVLKSAQEKDKATQNAAVQAAAKTLENTTQSSQASSNAAISMNQDMSANSAVAAATFSSQTTQASQQTATQVNQQQQTQQASSQTQQTSRQGLQVQQQQQDTQQASVQSSSIVQYQPPQQQEQQQTQSQTSTSVVKLMPPQQQEQQQTQSQMSAGIMTPQQNTYTPPQQQAQDTQSTQVASLRPPTPQVVEVQQQASTGTGITISRNLFAYNPLTSSSSSVQSITPPQATQMYQPRIDSRQFEVETPQMPIASFGGAGRAGNPLSEIMMQQRFEMMQNNVAQPASSVNRNVQPNELAGGVDIASMAAIPAGFNAYSIVLKDAAFYEPKEVYKNQRTVDNVRLLRGLTGGSDSLHQQMVDQQYKVGN